MPPLQLSDDARRRRLLQHDVRFARFVRHGDVPLYANLLFFGVGHLFTQAAFPDLFFDPPDDFVLGQTYPLGGWLLFGDEAPAPGRIYCIEPGSTLTPGEPLPPAPARGAVLADNASGLRLSRDAYQREKRVPRVRLRPRR
jgi:hypothetical protein